MNLVINTPESKVLGKATRSGLRDGLDLIFAEKF